MVIVMNVDLADQKTGGRKRERSCEKKRFVWMLACRRLFTRRNDLGET